MRKVTGEALDRAEMFLMRNARLLERRRFAHLFRGGPGAAVTGALHAYANPDGGYGNGLEPDLRGAASQPVPAQHVLEILHEAGADGDPAITRLCDWLASVSAPDGGVPFVLPAVRQGPHAPWWQTPDDPPGSLNPTATIAGLLHRIGSRHPWLGPATEFCWTRIAAMDEAGGYDALALLTFLSHAPDRERADAEFARLRKSVQEAATLDPHATGDVHPPLDFAPAPDALGRRLFGDDVIEEHLDALVEAQREDGGWTVPFLIWTPATEFDWRGWITVDRLKTLRSYGRLEE